MPLNKETKPNRFVIQEMGFILFGELPKQKVIIWKGTENVCIAYTLKNHFPERISSKKNITDQLEFELTYLKIVVQYFNNNDSL